MKYSIITKGTDNKIRLSYSDEQRFYERIRRDTSRKIVGQFREEMQWRNKPSSFKHYDQLLHICPTAVLRLQDNGVLSLKRYNGLVLLDVKPVTTQEEQEEIKRRAMSLPTTLAAFVGCSGRSVKLLVRVARADGSLPQEEYEADAFYATAYKQLLPIYTALIRPYPIEAYEDGMKHSFLMPLDTLPRTNLTAVPFIVSTAHRETTLSAEGDISAYSLLSNGYKQIAKEVDSMLKAGPWDEERLTELARRLKQKGYPQEEAFTQIWQDLRFKPQADMQQSDKVRSIVEGVYNEGEETGNIMLTIIRRLEQRYLFRHNTIMGFTEYRRNSSRHSPWQPVTERVINDLTIDLQLSGIQAWDRDVKRYVESNRVPDYNIIEEYLWGLKEKWDGQDHIRALARTIPTKTAEWPEWFHRFFLGMVAQWQHRNPRFGNSIVPLLISRQGFHKSDFCRQLLPPELRSWGYTDNASLSEERGTLLAMTQMLLICLDEFNQISPKKQEGFLKNIITMPTIKVKRPYARHVEDIPRLASFIATTNQSDVLADPSGSRRFIGILIDGDIDTHQQPNYTQLFAQALTELENGERYWFDNKETETIILHNRRFQLQSDALTYFYEYFETANTEDEDTEWLTAAALLEDIKSRARGLLKAPSLNKFARELHSLPDIRMKATRTSKMYLVRRR